jgi:hypothetical protein
MTGRTPVEWRENEDTEISSPQLALQKCIPPVGREYQPRPTARMKLEMITTCAVIDTTSISRSVGSMQCPEQIWRFTSNISVFNEDPIEHCLRASDGVLVGLPGLHLPQFILVCKAALYVKLRECFFDVGACFALVARLRTVPLANVLGTRSNKM